MRRVAVADIGGTHARLALAEIDGGSIALGETATLSTADYSGFEGAWAAFAEIAGPLPRALAIAAAGPVLGDRLPMTNGRWVLALSRLREELGLDALTALNDFGAVAHAVARLPADHLIHVAGPDRPLPERGAITVLGPGTGLGVAQLHRFAGGYHVQATEGGHIGFAPQDELDDRILADLRARFGRVVTERVHAGPGIVSIYAALGGTDLRNDRAVWQRGMARDDDLAARAVDRFCASLGTLAGDYALAHGASGVVIAGGLGLRLRDLLPGSEFGARFAAKPRYEAMMEDIPVKLIVHPEPGLYGAAAAFDAEHR